MPQLRNVFASSVKRKLIKSIKDIIELSADNSKNMCMQAGRYSKI